MNAHLLRGAALAALLAAPLRAHDGPPYPILVDEAVGGLTLSVWADPDVGIGTFYLYLPEEKGALAYERCSTIRIGARPIDGRLEEAFVDAEPADEDEPFQQVGEVPFDRRGMWTVRFVVDGPEGEGEVELDVDVTPPGLGPIDLVWFLAPFLAIGFLWIRVVMRKRALTRQAPPR